MLIEIHTDNNVRVGTDLVAHIQTTLHAALRRFSSRVARVDVRLADVNADKFGIDDKHCTMQTRLPRIGTVTVRHRAPTSALACTGAADKLAHALTTRIGRATEYPGAASIRTVG